MPEQRSNAYWAERARQNKLNVIKIGENGINELKRVLKTNLDDVQKEIKTFYDKYGDNPAEQLSYKEFERYKKDLKAKAKKYPKDKTLQRMAKQDIPKYRIDRLRQLEADLQIRLAEVTAYQETSINGTLKDVAKVSHEATKKMMKEAIGLNIGAINSKQIEALISTDWSGKNWSSRLWADREKLGKKLKQTLEKGIMQGTGYRKMARELKAEMGTSFNNAFRLIRTESAFIQGDINKTTYQQAADELGLEYYKYDAFLDSRTSEICRELDGKRFKVSEMQIGVNAPPMHPNCRSTTQLVLDENFEKAINVPSKEKESNNPGKADSSKERTQTTKKNSVVVKDKNTPRKSNEFLPMNDDVIENSRLQLENLSKKERAAIKKYTGEDYYTWINKYLRGENKSIPYEQKQVMENLINGLDKCKLPENAVLYRNVSPKFIEKMFNKTTADLISKGIEKPLTNSQLERLKATLLKKPIVEKGFCSTSYKANSFNKDANIILKINAPKGTKGAVIDKLSKFKKEKECLLMPNQNMTIKDIKLNGKQWEIIVNL